MRLLESLSERRRILLLAVGAVLLLLSSLWLPLWTMALEAPQYPDGLHMRAYGTRVEGDLREINIINHYVGMAPIDRVPAPEMGLFPWGMAALAAGILVSVLDRRLLKAAFVVTVLLPIGVLADLQWWLHDFGQNLDPHAPLRFIEPFTPLVLGVSSIGNFRSIGMVSWGMVAILGAAALLYLALRSWPRPERAPRPVGLGMEMKAEVKA